jgi:uncharacterized RDD family membrane protein YckC
MSDPRPTTSSGDPVAGYYTSPPPPGAGGQAGLQSAPVAAGWRLSGWWRRVGASIVDGIVILAAAAIMFAAVVAVFGSVSRADETAGVISLILGLLVWGAFAVVAALIYAPLMMARTNGRTLGRIVFGIRVVRANRKPVSFGWAALREVVVKWLLFYVIGGWLTFGLLPLIDVLWPLWDEEHRALHDFVVDSRTIRA